MRYGHAIRHHLGCCALAAPANRISNLKHYSKMKSAWPALKIALALCAPVLGAAIGTELYYALDIEFEYFAFFIFMVGLILSVSVLFKILDWRPWIKILAIIPFAALSLVASAFVSLIVASANGDGL